MPAAASAAAAAACALDAGAGATVITPAAGLPAPPPPPREPARPFPATEEDRTLMRKFLPLLLASLALASAAATPALAYIGPGAGITMLGALWGVVVAVALALGAVLFWPVRALLRRRKPPAAGTGAAAAAARGDDGAPAAGVAPRQGR